MRFLRLVAAAVVLGACAAGSRVETRSRAASFHARVLTIASLRGDNGKAAGLSGALVRRLQAGGFQVVSLAQSDSVLAGSALNVDIAADPRVLAEIRRATQADGIVFVTLDPEGRSLDVTVLAATSGDVVLRATAHPDDNAFESGAQAAAAAAEALSVLSRDPRKAAAAAREQDDDIPVP